MSFDEEETDDAVRSTPGVEFFVGIFVVVIRGWPHAFDNAG